MNTLFKSYDLWDLIENGYDEPNELDRPTDAQWHKWKEKIKKYAKALFIIQEALVDMIFQSIMGVVTSKEALDLL